MEEQSMSRLLCLMCTISLLIVISTGISEATTISISWSEIEKGTDQTGDFGTVFVGDGTEYICSVTGAPAAYFYWNVTPAGGYVNLELKKKLKNKSSLNWQSPPNKGNFQVTVKIYPIGEGEEPKTYNAAWKALATPQF